MASSVLLSEPPPLTERRDRPRLRAVLLASTIGSVIEWYDFFIFATAMALVFKPLFFPNISPTAGTLALLTTYAAGFVARPIGAVISGHLGDRIGRKAVLVASLLVMGMSTAAIGALPTYAQAGVLAPILLTTLRIVQGLAVGGEWGGAALLSVEHAPAGRRGLLGGFVQLGTPAGMLLATSTYLATRALVGEQAFVDWAWRLPFLASLALVALGLGVRLRVHDAEVFQTIKLRRHTARRPVIEVLRTQPRTVTLTIGLRLSQTALYYLLTTYSLVYLKSHFSGGGDIGLVAIMIASGVGLLSDPLWGYVSDRVGRRPPVLFGSALGVVALVLFFVAADAGSEIGVVLAVVLGLAVVHDAMYSPHAAWFAELFSTNVRYSGASLGYQVGAALGGGFAPLIAAALLIAGNGSPKLIVAYFAGLSILTFASALLARETHQPDAAQPL
ncbi:MAG: transporter, family, shikimate and dehydroshikimate transport protein [Solirubrobacteraceae bacterium]